MSSDTCFDFIPVPTDRASCVAVARDLETALQGRLPEARFARVQEALRNWESLAAEERGHLACALGWRRALFLEDGWLWERLDASASPPARAACARWAAAQTDILKDLPGARAAEGAEADVCIAHAERILALDLSRPEKPGYWVHRGAVDWTPRDEGIDNEVVIAALRLYPMLALARAHRLTGRAAFLRVAVDLLADLTWEIPGNLIRRVGLGGCSTHWGIDALDVAIRTNNLMALYSVVRTAPELTDEAAILIWKLLWFCGARGLEFWHKACHNIVFYEPAALGELGFLFPAFREAARWREASVRVQGRSARAEGPDRSLDLAFLADDRWAVVQETGFVATDYLSWVDAPVLRLTDCRSTSFNVVTCLRPLPSGVVEADSGDWRLEPALSVGCNAGDGEAIPEGQAVACTLQQPDGCIRFLWCEPGTGEKRLRSGATPTGGADDWSADGDLLIVRERRGAGPQVWARGASRVAQGENAVAHEAL
jgi:hypothetical protein